MINTKIECLFKLDCLKFHGGHQLHAFNSKDAYLKQQQKNVFVRGRFGVVKTSANPECSGNNFILFLLFYGVKKRWKRNLIYGHFFCNKMQLLCIHKLSIYEEKSIYLSQRVSTAMNILLRIYRRRTYKIPETNYHCMPHSIILWNLCSKVQFHCKSMSCWHDRNEIIMTFCCYHLVYCLSF